jgi:hypothetical protein
MLMMPPLKVSALLSRARGAQAPAPSPCTPSPAWGAASAWRGILSERKTTRHRCTHFQDHLVLETTPGFRIILGLENAKARLPATQPALPWRPLREPPVLLGSRLGEPEARSVLRSTPRLPRLSLACVGYPPRRGFGDHLSVRRFCCHFNALGLLAPGYRPTITAATNPRARTRPGAPDNGQAAKRDSLLVVDIDLATTAATPVPRPVHRSSPAGTLRRRTQDGEAPFLMCPSTRSRSYWRGVSTPRQADRPTIVDSSGYPTGEGELQTR